MVFTGRDEMAKIFVELEIHDGGGVVPDGVDLIARLAVPHTNGTVVMTSVYELVEVAPSGGSSLWFCFRQLDDKQRLIRLILELLSDRNNEDPARFTHRLVGYEQSGPASHPKCDAPHSVLSAPCKEGFAGIYRPQFARVIGGSGQEKL